MHNLDEYVPWITARAEKAEIMTVSQTLKVLVLVGNGEFDHGKYMGDVVFVYEMTSTSLQKTKEFAVNGSWSANMVFTAEDLVVMGFQSGEVCLLDVLAATQVGFVGDPRGYAQDFDEIAPNVPVHIATKPGCIAVAYETTYDNTVLTIRIFKGSHTAWTLHHVIQKLVQTDMCFFATTGLLAVLGSRNPHTKMEALEMYQTDPWELTGGHCMGTTEDCTSVDSVREHDGEWFVLRRDGTLSIMPNAHSSGKYQGMLALGTCNDYHGFLIGYGHYAHASGIIEVCTEIDADAHRASLVTVYAHQDVIAMASMTELRVTWMATVMRSSNSSSACYRT